jgi:chlorobactene glucosyltransferase
MGRQIVQHRFGPYVSTIVSAFSIGASLLTFDVLRKGLRDSATIGAAMRAAARAGKDWPTVAVLVPARDEEESVATCLTSILTQDYPTHEVIAVDDESTDRTAAIMDDLQRLNPWRLRIVRAGPVPAGGWVGKTNALQQGYVYVQPETTWLLFVDADTALAPGTLRAAVGYAVDQGLDLLSLVPAPCLRGFWSRLLIPIVARFYLLAQLDPLHSVKRGSAEEAVAIGQFILVRHDAYRAVGGHRTVRGSTAEDVALAKLFRAHGFRTLMTNGLDFVESESYQGLGELWEGTTKNLFVVARSRWSTLTATLAFEWFSGLIPVALLAFSWRSRSRGKVSMWLNRVAVGLVALSYGRYLRVIGVPLRYVALYPFSSVLASLIFLDSARLVSVRRSVMWKGRSVDARLLMSR